MKDHVLVTRTIIADPDAVWQTISKGADVDRWFPAITSCRLDGDQRHCTMANGAELVETIRKVDQLTRTFHYQVDQHPLPVGPVVSSLQVVDAGMGRTTLIWTGALDGEAASVIEVKEMLGGMYDQGIAALEAYHAAMV